MAKKQTAGRDQLGDFAPKFAELNDDVLFGQVWSREKELSLRDRSLLTVTALITKGAFEQLPYHMQTAKINVMGKMVEIAEGATFANVAKDFSGMVDEPIMLARQKNKLRELHVSLM